MWYLSTFYALLWPAETVMPHCAACELFFFIKMWPANIVEFETPAIQRVVVFNSTTYDMTRIYVSVVLQVSKIPRKNLVKFKHQIVCSN